MKRRLKNFRFRKMDEMERHIAARAQRNAYLFLTAALLIWSLYESGQVYFRHTPLNPFPCLLLAGAAAVQGLSQAALTRRAVQDDGDSWETAPLARLVFLACAVAAVLTAAAGALLLTGVLV